MWLTLLFITLGTFMTVFNPKQARSALTPIKFDQISGWSMHDKTGALKAFRRSCDQMSEDNRAFSKNPKFGGSPDDWRPVCAALKQLDSKPSQVQITAFFENYFTPMAVNDPDNDKGLFTGYFEPVVQGSLQRTDKFPVPLYKRPDDLVGFTKKQEEQVGLRYGRLVNGQPTPYFTRREIEEGLFAGQNLELLWLKNRADAFFMQIQGSGRVEISNGQTLRLAYAGKTGLPYTAIGSVLIKNGELEKADVSMQTIRQWMDQNPEKSKELMWHNKSFVFFRKLSDIDPALGPVGAQLVNLTAFHSLAIDRRFWAFGTPIWLDSNIELQEAGKAEPWQSLLIAQDTGSAILGMARGDVFWGSGERAAEIAGRMKAPARMIVLLPKNLAKTFTE